MKTLSGVDLASAASYLSVANTPLFLLRKLQAEPIIEEIANESTPEELISEITKVISHTAESSTDFVRPYVLLVALSRRADKEILAKLADISKTRGFEWFEYIRRVLIETSRPVSQQFDEMTRREQRPRYSSDSNPLLVNTKWVKDEVTL